MLTMKNLRDIHNMALLHQGERGGFMSLDNP